MKLDSIGELIATRTLTLQGSPVEVLVLLGKPQQPPDHLDYYCPYQIRGVGSEKVSYACGFDPLQALLLSLSSIAVELEVLNNDLGGKVSWDCGEKIPIPREMSSRSACVSARRKR